MAGSTATAGLIREARVAAGLTQAQLAARLHTTQSVVSRWERGGDEPRLSTLERILRACGRRLSLSVEEDDVDRAQIRQQLALSPADRLASVTNLSRALATARRVP
jgi:transcriptional regulator with XRE-family HTH domain